MVRRSSRFAYSEIARPTIVCALIIVSVLACSDGGKAGSGKSSKNVAASACVSIDTTPITLAVRDYISTASPTPQRYLSAYGTDSGLPDEGFKVLQDKGPSYYYGGDSVAKRKVRDKLASVGPYASMLVLFKGTSEAEGGNSVTVKLAGQYVGGEHEGKRSPLKTYVVKCDTTHWKIATSNVEPGS